MPEKKDYFFNFGKEKVKIKNIEVETLEASSIRGKRPLGWKRLGPREEINLSMPPISLNPTILKNQILNHISLLAPVEVK